MDAALSSAPPLDAPAALTAAGVAPGSWLVVRVDARAAAGALERQARLDAEAAARAAAAVAAEQARLVHLAAPSSSCIRRLYELPNSYAGPAFKALPGSWCCPQLADGKIIDLFVQATIFDATTQSMPLATVLFDYDIDSLLHLFPTGARFVAGAARLGDYPLDPTTWDASVGAWYDYITTSAAHAPPPSSSISPRSFKSLESAHSRSREAGASAAFWTLTHAAFPGAALENVLGRLLDERRLISNRNFTAGDFPAAFEAGRVAFAAATLNAEKPPAPTHGIQSIDFSGDYTKAAYGQVEADCLLKLPALAPCDWTRDPAATNPPFFINPPSLQPLPVRPEPFLQREGEPAGAGTRSRFSMDCYPANSAMYVVGEVYAPLGSEEPLQRTVQQLLQAERTLQFLSAKEGKPVGSCVLGMVFMGPHINAALASQLFRSLKYYKDLLPCLWSLYSLKRLLGFHMSATFSPEAAALLTAAAYAKLEERMQQIESRSKLEERKQQIESRAWCTVV